MPFNPKSDRNAGITGAASFGRKGVTITPDDDNDFETYAKTIVVLAAGDVVILPVENDDEDTLTFVGLSAGQVVPFQVRRVLETGTTAAVAAVID